MPQEIVARYYAAFNEGDVDGMLECLSDDIWHHVNEGGLRIGKEAFADFCAHMNRCYKEHLTDIVVMTSPDGTRAAAEFTVNGSYLVSDEGLPPANGQSYRLPAGTFFTLKDGLISRVVTYYNLREWVRQVSA